MSIAAEPLSRKRCLDTVFQWVEEEFVDGDLSKACNKAALRAKRQGLVSGPLWDEVGGQAIYAQYRNKVIQPQRKDWSGESHMPRDTQERPASSDRIPYPANNTQDHAPPNVTRLPTPPTPRHTVRKTVFSKWYHTRRGWMTLGEMTKKDCLDVAQHREKLVKANEIERDFFVEIAKRIDGKLNIGSTFTVMEMLELRNKFGIED